MKTDEHEKCVKTVWWHHRNEHVNPYFFYPRYL